MNYIWTLALKMTSCRFPEKVLCLRVRVIESELELGSELGLRLGQRSIWAILLDSTLTF